MSESNPIVHEYEEGKSTFEFCIKDKDGRKKQYQLREFDGVGLSEWYAVVGKRAKFSAKGAPEPGKIDYSKLWSTLIALCCWTNEPNEQAVPVSKETIDAWKASVQSDLFVRCQRMNGLDDEAAEKAKND